MRRSAQCLGAALLLISSACSSDDNYVLSGYGPVIISPVRSSLAAQMNFKDSSGAPHPQWVIAMSDTDDVCTKLATHPDYFQNPIESFDAAIVWVWPGNLGTYFVGQQDKTGSVAGNEILVGRALADGGSGQLTRFNGIAGIGATISLSQFNVGAGGQADVVTDLVSYSRSKGIYGGINLDGTVVAVSKDWNQGFYQKPVSAPDILVRMTTHNKSADKLIGDVSRATGRR